MMTSRINIMRRDKKNENSSATIIHRIQKLNKKFQLACSQIVLLNNNIDEITVRHRRAAGDNRKSYGYTLRLRLVTLEGIRNQFHKYAARMADILQLQGLSVPFACVGSGDPVRVLRLYTTNTLDIF